MGGYDSDFESNEVVQPISHVFDLNPFLPSRLKWTARAKIIAPFLYSRDESHFKVIANVRFLLNILVRYDVEIILPGGNLKFA